MEGVGSVVGGEGLDLNATRHSSRQSRHSKIMSKWSARFHKATSMETGAEVDVDIVESGVGEGDIEQKQ